MERGDGKAQLKREDLIYLELVDSLRDQSQLVDSDLSLHKWLKLSQETLEIYL